MFTTWFRTGVRDDGGLGHILIGTNETFEKDISRLRVVARGAVRVERMNAPRVDARMHNEAKME